MSKCKRDGCADGIGLDNYDGCCSPHCWDLRERDAEIARLREDNIARAAIELNYEGMVARLREENERLRARLPSIVTTAALDEQAAKIARLRNLANRARDHFLGYVVLNFEQEQALANEIGEEVRGE